MYRFIIGISALMLSNMLIPLCNLYASEDDAAVKTASVKTVLGPAEKLTEYRDSEDHDSNEESIEVHFNYALANNGHAEGLANQGKFEDAVILSEMAIEHADKANKREFSKSDELLGAAHHHYGQFCHNRVLQLVEAGDNLETIVDLQKKAFDNCTKAVDLRNPEAISVLPKIRGNYEAFVKLAFQQNTESPSAVSNAANSTQEIRAPVSEPSVPEKSESDKAQSVAPVLSAAPTESPVPNEPMRTFSPEDRAKLEKITVQPIKDFDPEDPTATEELRNAFFDSALVNNHLAEEHKGRGEFEAVFRFYKIATEHMSKAWKLRHSKAEDCLKNICFNSSLVHDEYAQQILRSNPEAAIASFVIAIQYLDKVRELGDREILARLRDTCFSCGTLCCNHGSKLEDINLHDSIIFKKQGIELLMRADKLEHPAAAVQLGRGYYNLGGAYYTKEEFEAAIVPIEMSIEYLTKAKEQNYPNAEKELTCAYDLSAAICQKRALQLKKQANGDGKFKDIVDLHKKSFEHCNKAIMLESPPAIALLPKIELLLHQKDTAPLPPVGSDVSSVIVSSLIAKNEHVTRLHREQSNKAYEALKALTIQIVANNPKNAATDYGYFELFKTKLCKRLKQLLQDAQPTVTNYKKHTALYTKLLFMQLGVATIEPVYSHAEEQSESAIFKDVKGFLNEIIKDVSAKVADERHVSKAITKVISSTPTVDTFLLILDYLHSQIIGDGDLIRTTSGKLQEMTNAKPKKMSKAEQEAMARQAAESFLTPSKPEKAKLPEKKETNADKKRKKAAEEKKLVAEAASAASTASTPTTLLVAEPRESKTKKKGKSKGQQSPKPNETVQTTNESSAVENVATSVKKETPTASSLAPTLPTQDLTEGAVLKSEDKGKKDVEPSEVEIPTPALPIAGASKPAEKDMTEGQQLSAQIEAAQTNDGITSVIATPDAEDTFKLPLKKKKNSKAKKGNLSGGAQATEDQSTTVETPNMAAAASVSVVLTVPTPSSPRQPEDRKAVDVVALTHEPKGKNKEELFFTAEYPRFRSNTSSPVAPIQYEFSDTTEVKASTLRELPLSILLPGVSVPEASPVPTTPVAPTAVSPMQDEVEETTKIAGINSSPYTAPDGLVIYGPNAVTYPEDRYRDMIARQRRIAALKAAMIAEGNGLPDAKTVFERDAIIDSIVKSITDLSTGLDKAEVEWRIHHVLTQYYSHACKGAKDFDNRLEVLESQELKAYTLMNDLRTRGV